MTASLPFLVSVSRLSTLIVIVVVVVVIIVAVVEAIAVSGCWKRAEAKSEAFMATIYRDTDFCSPAGSSRGLSPLFWSSD